MYLTTTAPYDVTLRRLAMLLMVIPDPATKVTAAVDVQTAQSFFWCLAGIVHELVF